MSENPQGVQNSLKQIYNFNNPDDFEGPVFPKNQMGDINWPRNNKIQVLLLLGYL
jgi:hypothetical protein